MRSFNQLSNNITEDCMETFYDDEDNYGGFVKTVNTKQSEGNRKDGKNKQDKQKLRTAKRSWEEIED